MQNGNILVNFDFTVITGNYRNGNVTGNVFRLPVNFEH